MSITFACESCGKSFTVDDKFAGKQGKCKQCGAVMAIPEATAARVSSRPVEREAASSRRPAAPSRPPIEDVYGFDDQPSPSHQGLPSGIDEVEAGAAVPGRFKPRSAGAYDPPKPKKKKKKGSGGGGGGGGGGAGTVIKIVVGIIVGLVGLGIAGSLLMSLAGLSSKGELESILQERVRLNEDLANVLANVTDVDSAREASPMANRKFRAISTNLRKLKATKGLQVDIDALKQKYAAAQLQVAQRIIGEINRIGSIPDAGTALDIAAAVEELAREEAEIPGNVPPPRAPFVPPPVMPGPRPGLNPGQNPRTNSNRTRPNNNRKGANRPNAGPPG